MKETLTCFKSKTVSLVRTILHTDGNIRRHLDATVELYGA